MNVLCLHLPTYIGEVNSGHLNYNFNITDSKFYADFRSGLRFGCYLRIFSRYVICLASEATCPLQWGTFSLGRTSKVTDSRDLRI